MSWLYLIVAAPPPNLLSQHLMTWTHLVEKTACQQVSKAQRDRDSDAARGPPPTPQRSFRTPAALLPDIITVWELVHVSSLPYSLSVYLQIPDPQIRPRWPDIRYETCCTQAISFNSFHSTAQNDCLAGHSNRHCPGNMLLRRSHGRCSDRDYE